MMRWEARELNGKKRPANALPDESVDHLPGPGFLIGQPIGNAAVTRPGFTGPDSASLPWLALPPCGPRILVLRGFCSGLALLIGKFRRVRSFLSQGALDEVVGAILQR